MPKDQNYTFGKESRLCGKKNIDRLFAEGRSFFAYPFRCVWTLVDPDPVRREAEARVLISVGKKNHKRAVARNLLKRRTREAYRQNRSLWEPLPLPEGKRLIFGLLYGSKEILEFSTIAHGVIRALDEIRRQLAESRDLSVGSPD